MRSPLISTILICSLVALAGCGVIMMCLNYLAHYSFLTTSAPVSPFNALAVIVLFALALVSISDLSPKKPTSFFIPTSPPPEQPLWQPLALAFSDGILNPKAF